MNPNKSIPSMFHRRLLLLLVVFGVFFLFLTGQIVRLSVVQGSQRLADAEARLDVRTYLPTHRGRILDRHNRVLAIDRASSDVAVEYSVITGSWMREQARLQARKELGKSTWSTMSPDDRDAAIKARLPEWNAKRDRLYSELCRLGDVAPDELLRRLDAIKSSVQSTAALVWERQRLQEQLEYGTTAEEFRPRPIREQTEAHVVLAQVADEIAFAFRKLDQEVPDVLEVQDSSRREYPWLNASVILPRSSLPRPIRSSQTATIQVVGVADHILGSMRSDVWESDVKRRPLRNPTTDEIDLGWYQPGDSVGSRGLERAFEDHLRGLRGEVRSRRNSQEESRIEAAPGRDLQLTLDIALQARVQAILSHEYGLARVQGWQRNASLPLGTPLNSAAVVIEIETGEILAMVSMPTLAMGAMMNDEAQQANAPQINRPVDGIYPPGSILKPFVLAAGIKERVIALGDAITCTGHYFPEDKTVARCWIFREEFGLVGHGPLRAAEALARSCNIYFFTIGDRLGMLRLIQWFRKFGLGDALNIGLQYEEQNDKGVTIRLGESGGSLLSEETIHAMADRKFSEVIMGIGQGPLTWTPVQAANAFATLARGGTIRDATLLVNDPRPPRIPRTADLELDDRMLNEILDGLYQSVMQRHGTGHHITYDVGDEEPIINAVGVQVWGKTGTAQANIRLRLDHSWYVGLVGPKASNGRSKPMHAIAVIVENGGSGGRTAGPIANQIIRALQTEGYLPGDPAASSSAPTTTSPSSPQPETED